LIDLDAWTQFDGISNVIENGEVKEWRPSWRIFL